MIMFEALAHRIHNGVPGDHVEYQIMGDNKTT